MNGRVLFYVQHLLGVGHVMRAAAIARALIAEKLDVLVVMGGETVGLADFGAARVHALPSARAADATFKVILDGSGNPIDDAWREGRRRELLAVAEEFAPSALLVEHFPFGRQKFVFELVPLFECVKSGRSGARAAILGSVRDVLVDTGKPALRQQIVEMARTWYDRILVHGDPAVIPFEASFSEASNIADLIAYTGYVLDDRAAAGPVPASGDGADEVIVSVGGGAMGERLMVAAMEAAEAGALGPRRWRLLAGDNLPKGVFAALAARQSDRVRVESARPDFAALLGRAALSISQGGYNTVMNVLTSPCPALVVPFDAPGEEEQRLRARDFERRGLIAMLDEHELTSETLARAAEATLAAPPRGRLEMDLNGTRRTAEIVADYARGAAAKAP